MDNNWDLLMVNCLSLMKASNWYIIMVKLLALYLEKLIDSHQGLMLAHSWDI